MISLFLHLCTFLSSLFRSIVVFFLWHFFCCLSWFLTQLLLYDVNVFVCLLMFLLSFYLMSDDLWLLLLTYRSVIYLYFINCFMSSVFFMIVISFYLLLMQFFVLTSFLFTKKKKKKMRLTMICVTFLVNWLSSHFTQLLSSSFMIFSSFWREKWQYNFF